MPDSAADQPKRIREWSGVDRATFDRDIASRYEPAVLRGLVRRWPLVEAAESAQRARDYLAAMDRGAAVRAFLGEPEIEGRFFHRPDFRGFNFQIVETSLARLLATLAAIDSAGREQSVYMGSTATAEILPGFAAANPLELVDGRPTEPRIWIGNASRIAPHFDESDNIACVASGRRRFTLFPPDQVANLYVGPIDQTVAGQPTSMVDLARPDFERFPRFREALDHALVADLEPGDAIYVPSLWWHAVESSGPLNILVNYWWSDAPPDAGSPLHALGHGLLTITPLERSRREAWRHLFDHYVFRLDGEPADHIPDHARGILGPTTPTLRQTIKAYLIRALQNL